MWSLLLISRTLLVKSVTPAMAPAIVPAFIKRARRRLRKRMGLRSASGFFKPIVEVEVLRIDIFQIRALRDRFGKFHDREDSLLF